MVLKAFENAQKNLKRYSMTAYDPLKSTKKAEMGDTKKGFSFLGCEIQPGMITPGKESRKRLLDSVNEAIHRSEAQLHHPERIAREQLGLVATLAEVNNVVKGWGNQYSFCNNPQILEHLDQTITERLSDYRSRWTISG